MKKYQTIDEIIAQCMEDIKEDISSLKFVDGIDFLDIFPKSEEHKNLLDNQALKLGKVVEKTERGTFYVFDKPQKTAFGELKIFKVRKFDITRLEWVAAPDFATTDYEKFVKRYKNDKRFSYIEKPTYKGLELKTEKSLVYFLDELTTEYYKVQ